MQVGLHNESGNTVDSSSEANQLFKIIYINECRIETKAFASDLPRMFMIPS
jgi:hypothetical protein